LRFERRYPKENSVFNQNQTFPPLNFWAGYAAGFIEILLRAAQKVFGSRMQLSEKWLRTTGINGVEFCWWCSI